jgi:hypothetical protein
MAAGHKTIPVRPDTWERLRAYKRGSATYDEVLNELMDALPLEEVAERVVREHRKRMASGKWRDWRAVRERLGDA